MRADKVCAKQPSPRSERSDGGPSGSDTRRRRGTGSSRPVTTGLVAVLLAVAVLLLFPGRAPAVQAILSDDAYTAVGTVLVVRCTQAVMTFVAAYWCTIV